MSRRITAAMSPHTITRRRSACGMREAATPITTALSPASTISIRMTWSSAASAGEKMCRVCISVSAAGSGPAHERRQRHQDGVHISPCLEAEPRAAVVEQIELGVAPAADELMLPLIVRPLPVHAPPHNLRINFEESETHVAHEGEIGIPVAARKPVEEDSAGAARFAPVRQEEIFVAPCL